MKTIIQFYAFLIFLMCSTLALQSAEEKPARKKPTLSVVIPYSCLDEDGYLYLQDFTNSSPEPELNFLCTIPRGDLPLPINHRVFDFEYKKHIIILSIKTTKIPNKPKVDLETIPSFSFPSALE